MDEDILSPALSLEQTYYNEGFALGQEDGTKAGQQEGRRFGLEKGFDKFSSMARIHGRAIVWNSRYSSKSKPLMPDHTVSVASPTENTHGRIFLPQLFNAANYTPDHLEEMDSELEPPTTGREIGVIRGDGDDSVALRIGKHVAVLYALTEVESLSMENTEEGVSDFDDRYRRAVAKAGIIGRIAGEGLDAVGMKAEREEGIEGDGYVNGGATGGEGEVEDIVLQGRGGSAVKNSKLTPEIYRDDEELEIEIR